MTTYTRRFSKKHYEALAEGMAIMAHGLERMGRVLENRAVSPDMHVVKAHTASAVMDAMCAVFEADNPNFNRGLFRKKFVEHYCIELRNLDNDYAGVYNVDEYTL